jgi:hypothetical protein
VVEALQARRADVERILRDVPGFRSYYLLRTGDGMAAVTVCDDRAGTERSSQVAAAFLREQIPGVTVSPPTVLDGEVAIALD